MIVEAVIYLARKAIFFRVKYNGAEEIGGKRKLVEFNFVSTITRCKYDGAKLRYRAAFAPKALYICRV